MVNSVLFDVQCGYLNICIWVWNEVLTSGIFLFYCYLFSFYKKRTGKAETDKFKAKDNSYYKWASWSYVVQTAMSMLVAEIKYHHQSQKNIKVRLTLLNEMSHLAFTMIGFQDPQPHTFPQRLAAINYLRGKKYSYCHLTRPFLFALAFHIHILI